MAKNTFKNKKPEKAKPKKSFKLSFSFIEDRKFQIALGLLFTLSSVFLFISILSYFSTGREDQSVVDAVLATGIKESGMEVTNWFGIVGATAAHFFVFKWFGLASLLVAPLLFVIGYQLLYQRQLLPIMRFTVFVIFYVLWISMVMGYFLINSSEFSSWGFLSGGIGYEMSLILESLMGWGAGLILLFLVFVFNMYFFNITQIPALVGWTDQINTFFDRMGNLFQSKSENEEEEKSDLSSVLEQVKKEVEQEDEQKDRIIASNMNEEEDDDEEEEEWAIEPLKQEKPKPIKEGPIFSVEPQKRETPPAPEAKKPEAPARPQRPITAPVNEPEPEPEEEEVVDNTIAFEPIVPTSKPKPTPMEDLAMEVEETKFEEKVVEVSENYDPTLDLPRYQFPSIDLLIEYPEKAVNVSKEELEANKDKIVETLINFKIGISSIKATIGPTVTLYEIIPEAGVKISKIKNLEDDIALSLAALGIRIIAPIPGRGTIGIEVPNKDREMVDARSVISTEKFMKSDKDLPVVLGKTISNEVFVTDLSKMPHLLMAGATGQGKSVGLNIILTSLLYKKHPSQLKFVLVDPKKVELTLFNHLEKHYLAKLPDGEEAIITDTSQVIHTLNSLCIEMDNRYDLLKDAACRNIKEYNKKFVNRRLNPQKGHSFMPYIVLVIDELADLMMTAGKEVETPIARLAQLARAIGIHLIVATQRPSVNVITGIIKANFPARLSFRVTSKVDSRTILDTGGAEQLIGMGDMLLSLGSEMTRLQCAFVDTPEVDRICEFIGDQRGYDSAYQLPEFVGEDESSSTPGVDLSERDVLFPDAARLIVTHQQGSTSLIQRKMKLGYNRAGRLIDQLEVAGIVGPFEGSKAREVLIKDEYSLEQLLTELENKY
ncbi:MAG: DNA translocase FtsK [Cytophagales bacterium]|nr:DNA translocase FtsK [Cytophagales bacterium]